jgi:hypothetical protein
MNTTGVKLNYQGLRNAEYFGEFKTSMYQLASEQLPRWRNWKIFTEDNIARMHEVELTSEFAFLMLRGVTGKSKTAIDRIYKEKDSEYFEREEVEHRFRIIMDTIDDKPGKEMKTLPFKKKTIFYSLFSYFYDVQFGIGSPLEKMRQKLIPPETIAKVKLLGDRIQKGTAPKAVLDAVTRRTTNKDSRLAVLNYFRSEIQHG